jgi:hypothetical protein
MDARVYHVLTLLVYNISLYVTGLLFIQQHCLEMDRVMNVKSTIARHITVYRVIVAIGFIIAMILSLAIPAQMIGASPWAYYF